MMISTAVVAISVIIMVIKGVSCYLGLDGSIEGDWSTAVMQCDRNNASLMAPSSDWENKFIYSYLLHFSTMEILSVFGSIVMMLKLKVNGTATRTVNIRLNIGSGSQTNQMMRSGQVMMIAAS